jgi:tight adherence protein C
MDVVAILGAVAVVGSFFVAWWAVAGARTERVELGVQDSRPADLRSRMLEQGVNERVTMPVFERLGAWLRRRSPGGRIDELSRKLVRAGSPSAWTVERLLVVKVLLSVVAGWSMFLVVREDLSSWRLLLVIGAAGIGFYAPNAILERRADERAVAIRAQLSDVIDQLSMMVQAGLGIDAAMARAARSGSGPLAEELTRVGNDVRVGVERSVALANLADRVDVPELKSFVAALAQAERLGVPVSQTLQIQAAEMRLKRRQFAEEQAMKLPVKLLFPLVFCILPVMFLVLLGPAAMRILEDLTGL